MLANGAKTVDVEGGARGAFEIIIDGELRYSKQETNVFPTDEEVEALTR